MLKNGLCKYGTWTIYYGDDYNLCNLYINWS